MIQVLSFIWPPPLRRHNLLSLAGDHGPVVPGYGGFMKIKNQFVKIQCENESKIAVTGPAGTVYLTSSEIERLEGLVDRWGIGPIDSTEKLLK